MLHISLLPALSWRVTSVWSPRLAAQSLPSSVYSFPTSYTDANGWKWENSCLRIGGGFLEFKSSGMSIHPTLRSTASWALSKITVLSYSPARCSRQSWLESPLSEPSGWHIKLLPMSEIVGWPRNQAAGDLESSSWPNWPSKKAGQDVLELQTFRAARDLQQGQNVQTLTQNQSLKWCTWNIELGWGKSVTQKLVFVKAHLKNMLGKEVIIPT